MADIRPIRTEQDYELHGPHRGAHGCPVALGRAD